MSYNNSVGTHKIACECCKEPSRLSTELFASLPTIPSPIVKLIEDYLTLEFYSLVIFKDYTQSLCCNKTNNFEESRLHILYKNLPIISYANLSTTFEDYIYFICFNTHHFKDGVSIIFKYHPLTRRVISSKQNSLLAYTKCIGVYRPDDDNMSLVIDKNNGDNNNNNDNLEIYLVTDDAITQCNESLTKWITHEFCHYSDIVTSTSRGIYMFNKWPDSDHKAIYFDYKTKQLTGIKESPLGNTAYIVTINDETIALFSDDLKICYEYNTLKDEYKQVSITLPAKPTDHIINVKFMKGSLYVLHKRFYNSGSRIYCLQYPFDVNICSEAFYIDQEVDCLI